MITGRTQIIAALDAGEELETIIMSPDGKVLGQGVINRDGGSFTCTRKGVAYVARINLGGGQVELPLHEPVRGEVGTSWKVEFMDYG